MELDLDHFKSLLLKHRQELLEDQLASEESSQTVELDQTRQGRLSRMDALQGQAMSKEIQRRREIELKRIDAALGRMESGDYGYCLECGEEIAVGRLEAEPANELCIDCAGRQEAS